MKIKITTDRMVWAGGKPQENGSVVEVSADEAKAIIHNGLAVAVEEPEAPKAKAKRGASA